MRVHRRVIWAILALHVASLAVFAAEMMWQGSIQSVIYNAIIAVHPTAERQQAGSLFVFGRWLIAWWFMAVLITLTITWLAALFLAARDSAASASNRRLWGLAIFLIWFPAVIAYCIAKLLRPNNSFKPNPLRGSA